MMFLCIGNEVIIQLMLKIYNSEHLVLILSFSQTPKYEAKQTNSNQRLKRCLEIMFSTIISNGNS